MSFPDHPTVELPCTDRALEQLVRAAPLDPAGVRDEFASALAGDLSARPGHLCASAWTLDLAGTHGLLVEHPRFGWMPPGGHVVAGESIEQAAGRELAEETGVSPHSQHVLSVHGALIPARPGERAHMHWTFGVVNLADRCVPLAGEVGQLPRWWPLDAELPDSFFGDNPLLRRYAEMLFPHRSS